MFDKIVITRFFAAMALLLAATTISHGDDSNNASDSETVDSYWVGVQAVPANETLKSHLQIESGLIARHLVPDAPGAKAGIEVHDVLLKYNEKVLNDISDLVDAVAEYKGAEATVTLIRAGKETTLKVTPAERPEGSVARIAIPPDGAAKGVYEWLRNFEQGNGDTPLRFQYIRPGFAMPRRFEKRMNLPKGTTISVTKENDGPAKIVVKRDEETWEVTEDALDELPKDVRPMVERFLGRGFSAQIDLSQDSDKWLKNIFSDEKTRKEWQEKLNRATKAVPLRHWPITPQTVPNAEIQKQFDELRGDLKLLHEKIDELHSQRSNRGE